MDRECEHLADVRSGATRRVEPRSAGCEECLAKGQSWVHLRLCLTCGHVGCCDNSPGRHATAHYHQLRHPVIHSFEPGEDWAYCYADEITAEHVPGETPEHHLSGPQNSA